MQVLTSKIRRFLANEDGATAVEYAVMVALIVVVCITAIQTIGNQANTSFGTAGTAMTTANGS
jgi:pilus assembly protein Flp/PilA